MSSKFVETLVNQLKSKPGSVILPEGDDTRCVEAAYMCLARGIATKVILIGTTGTVQGLMKASANAKALQGYFESGALVIQDSCEESLLDNTATHLKRKLEERGKSPTPEELVSKAKSPLHQGAYLLSHESAEACVAGCVYTTADVIRAGLAGLGLAKGIKTISSSFLMNRDRDKKTYIYTDCGVVIDPTAEQLVDITYSSVGTFTALNPGVEPVVAFLSFSSMGSAKHPSQEKMASATELFRGKFPDIKCEGELQFDAAFDERIGAKKAPGSSVPGRANVFVFPDLNSGNISYKITQRLGEFEAFGPILQGFTKIFSDLSRGANAEDIFASCAISILRSRL